ncbi:hypothetical protein GGP44_003045 [Salinibacter ruber]|nr:hypothetical protein [Salinibacter ruber]
MHIQFRMGRLRLLDSSFRRIHACDIVSTLFEYST